MELFELILILLACVMASSMLSQLVSHLSLPLVQIAVGLVVALLLPELADVHIDAELFLMLFIAPLLYRDSREVDIRTLMSNKWSVLSMAIPLVIVSVLAAGSTLHAIIPAIPLTAAFGCAAALGPTDAAAVSAMSSSVSLNERQSILLTGEALINDASGVVAFQFAIVAAVTGAFSARDAAGSFVILFFGGILVGAIIGFMLRGIIRVFRRKGFMDITTHVIFEVFTPFVLFLFAEEIHVSGILAVVACGIAMQDHTGNIKSSDLARQELVSNSVWEVLLFLINGILFVMLGMQLPKVLDKENMGMTSPWVVIGTMLAVTAMITIIRFLWVSGMELIHKDPATGQRGAEHVSDTLKQALVTTIAGPKGAVTLSIIMTTPLYVDLGAPFPNRDLIIFLTSGVILCTLLLANFLLPWLSPIEHDESAEEELSRARIEVLDRTVKEMRAVLDEHADAKFAPAFRLTLMRYRVRLMRERLSRQGCGQRLADMIKEVLDVQQARADEFQEGYWHIPETERLAYYSILPMIRESVGYFSGAEKVGARFETRKGRMLMRIAGLKRQMDDYDDDEKARIYYETVIFALDLEDTAVHYLQGIIKEGDPQRVQIANVLMEEHKAALQSLWGRINYNQEVKLEEVDQFVRTAEGHLPAGMQNNAMEQFRMASRYNDEADANAMQIELDKILECRLEGLVDGHQARLLREEVYLMQSAMVE